MRSLQQPPSLALVLVLPIIQLMKMDHSPVIPLPSGIMVLDTACLRHRPVLYPFRVFPPRPPTHQCHTHLNLLHLASHRGIHPIHHLQIILHLPDIPLTTHTLDT